MWTTERPERVVQGWPDEDPLAAERPRRQADAAAAGALLLDDVDEDPESDFFDDESDDDELFASLEPLDDESADTFSLAGLPESTEPARLSVR